MNRRINKRQKEKNKKKEVKKGIVANHNGILQVILSVIWIVWRIVVLLYRLFFKIPAKPSYLLGLFRTISWILILCRFDFYSLGNSEENIWLQFIIVVLPFACIGFLIVSFFIMIGFRYPWYYNGVDRSVPGLENHPNIQSTMDIMDAQLSSSKTRSNFIDAFLKQK